MGVYGICRVEKVKAAGVKAMQYHNDRMPGAHSNEDIDPARTPLNYEMRPHGAYASEVRGRVERFRTSARKVRKDAVMLVEGIVTASPEWFAGHTEGEARAFFADAFEFVRREMGDENVVHFTVHMDETTPHAHWGATPIKDGRLSWKMFFDGASSMRAFQDRFNEQVGARHGMERGERGTGRRHVATQQLKRDAQREVAALREEEAAHREAAARAERESAEASERLEWVQRGLEAAEAERGGIERVVEPVEEAGALELAALAAGRGLGERERRAEEQNRELGAKAEGLERDCERARGRVGRARGRLERAREAVRDALRGLRALPAELSRLTREIARQMGLQGVMEAPEPTPARRESVQDRLRRARAASAAHEAARKGRRARGGMER